MSTTDWPASIVPAAVQWQLQKAGTQFTSPFNGTTQAVDYVAERWQVSLSLPAVRSAGAVAALLNNMAGGVNRVNLWHHGTGGQPAGTLRGSPTLGTGAARGDASVVLANCTSGGQWIAGSGFELDSNFDGLSDGLTAYQRGTYSGRANSRPGGTWAYNQRVLLTSLGGTYGDQVGFRFTATFPVTAGLSYSYSADLLGSTTNQVALDADFYTADNVYLGRLYGSWAGSGVGFDRRSVSGTAPVGAAYAVLYAFMHTGTGAAPEIRVDNVQFEQAAAATAYGSSDSLRPPTLLAGDMIGCSGHLFQVASDCTANDGGAMTVPLVNRVRATIASSTAVT